MREAEFDSLLDMVRSNMRSDDHSLFEDDEHLILVPIAANDNDGAWPHLPFPDGWTASC